MAALVVPAVWFWFGRARGWRYPFAVDVLIVLPFLIDMAGNAANLYDSVSWWDDLNHLVNWAILVTGFGLVVRGRLPRVVVAGLAVGFGAVTAVLWEFLEYVTFIRHSSELRSAFRIRGLSAA